MKLEISVKKLVTNPMIAVIKKTLSEYYNEVPS